MTSKERILAAINHKETDRVPIDLGATPSSGKPLSVKSRIYQQFPVVYYFPGSSRGLSCKSNFF